jgi:hypothetical protein
MKQYESRYIYASIYVRYSLDRKVPHLFVINGYALSRIIHHIQYEKMIWKQGDWYLELLGTVDRLYTVFRPENCGIYTNKCTNNTFLIDIVVGLGHLLKIKWTH